MSQKPTYDELIKKIEYLEAENDRLKDIEKQLRHSKRLEEIGTLAGGVAHDLNNILSGIVSYPEVILMDLPEDSPMRKPVMAVKRSGEKAADIVRDLLTLTGRNSPVSETLNLNDIIADLKAGSEFQNMKHHHPDVKIVFELEMPLDNIKGSSVNISRSIMNLICIAAESINGKGRITVSTRNKHMDTLEEGYYQIIEKGMYTTLRIMDTGTGISDNDLSRIFEPFYTKKVMARSGTGLEMPVVWGTVRDHKAFIDIRSIEGRGTKYIIYFPVTGESRPQKLPGDLRFYIGEGESILVVDDLLEQREIASVLLDKLGYSVSSVSSGEEAINYIKKNHIDLIILDMIMDPGIDGLETYKRIIEIRPNQKILIASGYSETGRTREFINLGGSACINKPYTILDLGKAVKEELQKNNLI